MTNLWPSIEIIFEQEDLLQRPQEEGAKIKKDGDHKPRDATRIIKVLNSKTKDELEEFEIEDSTEVVLEARKI